MRPFTRFQLEELLRIGIGCRCQRKLMDPMGVASTLLGRKSYIIFWMLGEGRRVQTSAPKGQRRPRDKKPNDDSLCLQGFVYPISPRVPCYLQAVISGPDEP